MHAILALPSLVATALLCACGAVLADGAPAADDLDTDASVATTGIATPMPQGRRAAADPLAAPRYLRTEPALPNLAALPAAAGATRAELSEISRRWWLSHERADIGVGLGTAAYIVPAGDARDGQSTFRNAVAALSVGMRYRVSPESAVYADASNAPGLYGKGSDAYSAKVGVEWHGVPRTGWGFMQGGVGLRMDSGKTMTMRVKGGGLGVYLRSKF